MFRVITTCIAPVIFTNVSGQFPNTQVGTIALDENKRALGNAGGFFYLPMNTDVELFGQDLVSGLGNFPGYLLGQ